jgi:hypothetical protein
VADPPPGIAAGLLLAGPDALRAHLRRERPDPRRTALLHVRSGAVRSRHPQWRAAAAAAGLPVRRGGTRGIPAAGAPPEAAEALARGLATTLPAARPVDAGDTAARQPASTDAGAGPR